MPSMTETAVHTGKRIFIGFFISDIPYGVYKKNISYTTKNVKRRSAFSGNMLQIILIYARINLAFVVR